MSKKDKNLTPADIEEMRAKIRQAAQEGRIEMAPQEKIEKIPVDYLVDFFEKIIGIRYWDCFITDESSLHDFPEDAKYYKDRIKEVYKVSMKYDKRLIIHDIVKQLKSKLK
jgi:hypothetical protein